MLSPLWVIGTKLATWSLTCFVQAFWALWWHLCFHCRVWGEVDSIEYQTAEGNIPGTRKKKKIGVCSLGHTRLICSVMFCSRPILYKKYYSVHGYVLSLKRGSKWIIQPLSTAQSFINYMTFVTFLNLNWWFCHVFKLKVGFFSLLILLKVVKKCGVGLLSGAVV